MKTFIFIMLCAITATLHAATHVADSASFAHVNAKVAIANDGDTVQVPAGSETWSSTLYISGITLEGAGIGQTVITTGGQSYLIRATIQDDLTRITGFSFNGNQGAENSYQGINFTGTFNGSDYWPYRLDNCKLYYWPDRAIWVGCIGAGLIDNNILEDNLKQCDVFAGSLDNMTASFAAASTIGTTNVCVVEDNVINQLVWNPRMGGTGAAATTGQGGRMAWRFNTYNLNQANMSYWPIQDVHGNHKPVSGQDMTTDPPGGTGGHRGNRHFEWYGNTINRPPDRLALTFDIRGGYGLVYSNTFTGGDGILTPRFREEGRCSGDGALNLDPDCTGPWEADGCIFYFKENYINGVLIDSHRVSDPLDYDYLVEGTNVFWGSLPGGYTMLEYPHPLRGEGAQVTFYVDPAGDDGDDGSIGSPFATIAHGLSMMQPGYTLDIRAGTYAEPVNPIVSGTSDDWVTIRAHTGETVTISDATSGINMAGVNYNWIQDIDFTNIDLWGRFNSCDNNVVTNCTFTGYRGQPTYPNSWAGWRLYNSSQSNIFDTCSFEGWGWFDADDHGAGIDIGTEADQNDATSHNVIRNSTFKNGGHHLIGLYGKFNIIRSNYLQNIEWFNYSGTDYGNRCIISHGYDQNAGWNLVESNIVAWAGIPSDNVSGSGFSCATVSNIVRRNVFHNSTGPGLFFGATSAYYTSPRGNAAYNNSFMTNGTLTDPGYFELKAGIGLANWDAVGKDITNNFIANNIMWGHDNWAAFKSPVLESENITSNNWEQASLPGWVNTLDSDITDHTTPDLRLAESAAQIDNGGYLTYIETATGSGTSFVVNDSRMFMDGWGMVTGDTIQFEGTATTRTITDIDHSTRTITVNSSVSWTLGDGIALAWNGNAPDQGAYESDYSGSDTNAPVVSDIVVTPGSITALVTFTTDEPAKAGLEVGLTGAYGTELTNNSFLTEHSHSITSLVASTTYHYTIHATDQSDNTDNTADDTFATGAAGGVLAVSPSSLDFGMLAVDQTSDLIFYATNTTSGTISGTASSSGAPYTVESGGTYNLDNGDSWPITIRYAPTTMGTNDGTITLTGGGGETVSLTGQAAPLVDPSGWEAEDGLISAPFVAAAGVISQASETAGDPLTSGAGRAVYALTNIVSGTYQLNVTYDAPSGGANSIYWRWNTTATDPYHIWDMAVTSGEETGSANHRGNGSYDANELVPSVQRLFNNTHIIYIYGREANVDINSFSITLQEEGVASGRKGGRPGRGKGFRKGRF